MGKPISTHSIDVNYAVTQYNYFAEAAYPQGHTSLNTPGFLNMSLRQPFGVVAVIIPWNAPLIFFSKKVAPALAAGNCVVVKSSEKAPLTVSFVIASLEVLTDNAKAMENLSMDREVWFSTRCHQCYIRPWPTLRAGSG
jgi:acyl-CoA reductase-like NAD-dependent aldehyde dehydrogenase